MVSILTRSDVINPRYLELSVITQSYVLSTLAQCCYGKRCVINPRSVLLRKVICYQPSLSKFYICGSVHRNSRLKKSRWISSTSLSVAREREVLSTLALCCYTERCVINPSSVLLHKAMCYQPSLSVATENDVLSILAQCCYTERCVINPRSVLLHRAMCYQPKLSVAT